MANKTNDSRVRVWTFIVWKESAPSNWIDKLDDLHIPTAISPLHDKDVHTDDQGDKKKPHWHVILNFSGKQSYESVKEITDSLNAGFPVRVREIGAMSRYLIHEDNKDKHHYNRDDIVCLGGYDIDLYFDFAKSRVMALRREVLNFIITNDIIEFSDLVEYCVINNPDWEFIIAEVCTNYITEFIKSRRHRKKDHIDKVNNSYISKDGELC